MHFGGRPPPWPAPPQLGAQALLLGGRGAYENVALTPEHEAEEEPKDSPREEEEEPARLDLDVKLTSKAELPEIHGAFTTKTDWPGTKYLLSCFNRKNYWPPSSVGSGISTR